jgi:GDA1/CD39 (nucleoside phosphatase) family
MTTKHPLEAKTSWNNFLQQKIGGNHDEYLASDTTADHHRHPHSNSNSPRRQLKEKKHHHHQSKEQTVLDLVVLEQQREDEYLKDLQDETQETVLRASSKHKKLMKKLLASPSDIDPHTVHGFMIDAGSTGSRIHLYEWSPRVLSSHRDVEDAVAGRKLSFPTSQSRWSDRLRPGLATFAQVSDDDELVKAVSDYLSPLLEFAKMILREKGEQFGTFPIFLRATAGMRTLTKTDRFRVLDAVRKLFHDKSFCPFYFEDEFARVLSGEEESVFAWAGTNFVMGNLLQESQGVGTVLIPRLTHGALDLGGASTQISFYEPHEDIMSGLFKLQIGQGKHWNIYAHR